MKRFVPALIMAASLLGGAFGHAGSVSIDVPRFQHFLHALRALPVAATAASRLDATLLRVVKRDPKLAVKYFRIAMNRLWIDSDLPPHARSIDAQKILLEVEKTLKKRGMSRFEQLNEVLIEHGLLPVEKMTTTGYPVPIPDVTPTPMT